MLRGGTSEILAFLIHSEISRNKKDIAKILKSPPGKMPPLKVVFFRNMLCVFEWLSHLEFSFCCPHIAFTSSVNV